jgi:hypothetical protein
MTGMERVGRGREDGEIRSVPVRVLLCVPRG